MVSQDETFVAGLDQQTANKLLDAAKELDVDPAAVRTTDSGFVVPSGVAQKAGYTPGDALAIPADTDEDKKDEPSKSRTAKKG